MKIIFIYINIIIASVCAEPINIELKCELKEQWINEDMEQSTPARGAAAIEISGRSAHYKNGALDVNLEFIRETEVKDATIYTYGYEKNNFAVAAHAFIYKKGTHQLVIYLIMPNKPKIGQRYYPCK